MGDGNAPHSEDIGPAWIYRPDEGGETVLDGAWITRADAQRIAAETGYELRLDDGFEAWRQPVVGRSRALALPSARVP